MVLVSMGSQPLQCERIINAILNSNIKDKLVIQGYYKNESQKLKYPDVKFIDFVSYDEMEKLLDEADIVIVSGTGGIFRSLQKNKKVIIFPRLGKYGEAIGDHGMDMKSLSEDGYAEFVEDEKDFKKIYLKCKESNYKKFISNQNNFVKELDKCLKEL